MNSYGHHKCLWDDSGQRRKDTHTCKYERYNSAWPPLTVRLCLLSKSWTSEHSHACTEVHPRKSPASSQFDCCFVPLLVCAQQRDTELWVSLLWTWCAGLIEPDHKREPVPSSQVLLRHPKYLGASYWSDNMVTEIDFISSDTWKKGTLFSRFTTEDFWNTYLSMKWSAITKVYLSITICPDV